MEPTPVQKPALVLDNSKPKPGASMTDPVDELPGFSKGPLTMSTPAIPTPIVEPYEAVEDQQAVTPITENAVGTMELDKDSAVGSPAPKAGTPPLENENAPGLLEPENKGAAILPKDEDAGPSIAALFVPVVKIIASAELPPKYYKTSDGVDFIFDEDSYFYHPLMKTEDVKDRNFEKILGHTRCQNPDLTVYLVHLNGDLAGSVCWIEHKDVVNYFRSELAVYLRKQKAKAQSDVR